MLHEAGQRHLVRGSERAYREAVAGERLEHVAACAVGERGEHRVELVVRILNHMV